MRGGEQYYYYACVLYTIIGSYISSFPFPILHSFSSPPIVRPGGNPSNHSIHQQHVLEKRHGGTHSDDGLSSKEARKLARCGHLSSPIHTVGTPLLTDLNSDGRLDIVYDVIWSPAMAVPPQMLVVATDLEVLFKSAYGSQILDFESFLPPEEQPWTKYMGKEGDCLFRLHPQS